jgi:hypothetical protein
MPTAWCLRSTLWISEDLFKLLDSKDSVLDTSSVFAKALNHQLLVGFGKTLRFHGRVWHPPNDEQAPQGCDAAVKYEKGLPLMDRRSIRDEGKKKSDQPADDLLQAIHHIPALLFRWGTTGRECLYLP